MSRASETIQRHVRFVATAIAIVTCSLAVNHTMGQDPGSGWDEVFRDEQAPYVREPNSFLVRCMRRLADEGLLEPGSSALVLAMGDGRNAVELAVRGLDVTGIDISQVGIEKAEVAAAKRGVKIRTVKADMFQHDLGDGAWDLVTNVYFNPSIRILQRIERAVRPGGFLLIEGFSADYTGPGPPPWSRYKANQLLDELQGWRILEYQDGLFESDWADGRAVPVVRVLAQKPAR